jgi:hypothetical protein
MRLRIALFRAAIILCFGVVAVLGQSNPYGLIAIKANAGPEGMEKKPTTSRLFVLGPTNQYKLPVLRLVITDKPFMAGRLTLFEGTVVTVSNEMRTFKIPLVTNRFPQTSYAQMVDVPITTGPVIDMLVAMLNSPPSATVAIDVVDADFPSQSKSYIVPLPAIQELRRQYIAVKTAK